MVLAIGSVFVGRPIGRSKVRGQRTGMNERTANREAGAVQLRRKLIPELSLPVNCTRKTSTENSATYGIFRTGFDSTEGIFGILAKHTDLILLQI